MEVTVIVGPDGKLMASISQGTYEAGKRVLADFMAELKAAGIEFADEGKIEQHRHDTQHVHLNVTNQAHNH